MTVWQVRTEDQVIHLGEHRRRMLTRQGCNEPFQGIILVSPTQVVSAGAMPVSSNKHECNTYYKLCGSL